MPQQEAVVPQPGAELQHGSEFFALPRLREDLGLHPGPTLKNGAPTWVIEDPPRGRFFRIGWLEFELLSRWSCSNAVEVARLTAEQTLLKPTLEEVLAVSQFLVQHELALDPQRQAQIRPGRSREPGLATKALHHYLMFRIPLVNPDSLLQSLLPWFKPLLGRVAFFLSMLAGLFGLGMALQQWDTFTSTFVETLSVQGLLSYSVALVFAKVLHEMGHAFTAKSLGLRVPRMGVALVLLLPMLYTDTGETWRLRRRQDRFRIAFAGMRIEIMLAAWCTLAWNFLPDGGLRGAMFFLATASWVMTLAINASPFMRFDGYYMLSDATGIPNLHDEAGKVLRHFLRSSLLGLKQSEPVLDGEDPPAWLLWFGLASMVYRFFLFLGIALMVYHFFFKLLGIFLFVVEIWWFIARPFFAELRVWWKARRSIEFLPAMRSTALLGIIALMLLAPWQGRILAEGWVRAGQEFSVYPPRTARLLEMPRHLQVTEQGALARLVAPDLALREARAKARIGGLDSRLNAATGAESLPESLRSTRQQLNQQWVEIQGTAKEARQLELLAPFTGRLVDVAQDLAAGQVVSRQEMLARVIDPSHWIAEVFVDEEDLKRLQIGARARAYLHGVHPEVIGGHVDEIDTVPLDQLPSDMLAARFGGFLLTTDDLQQLKPLRPLFRVRLTLQSGPSTPQARLAGFNIEGERVSLLGRIARAFMSTLMLQSSF